MFEKRTFFIDSSDGESMLPVTVWIPEYPKAIVQISHSMCEYIDLYDEFANYLNDQGIIVCGNDQLGHGTSVKSESQLGFISYNNGYKHLVEDLQKTRVLVQARFPKLPYFIVGNSLGSLTLCKYLEKYSDGLAGCVCCSAFMSKGLNFMIADKLIDNRIKKRGPRYRSDTFQRIYSPTATSGTYPKEINFWLTRDVKMLKRLSSDPFCNYVPPVSTYKNVIQLSNSLSNPNWGRNIHKNLSILFLAGKLDALSYRGKHARKLSDRLKKFGMKDASYKVHPDTMHNLLFELNRKEIYDDISSWIAQRIAS